MTSVLRPALSLIVLMTLITGVAYPLVVTGVAQVAFPDQANGSLVRDAQGKASWAGGADPRREGEALGD